MIHLKILELDHCSKFPEYAHVDDAGIDLFASNELDILIEPGQCKPVKTGVVFETPKKSFLMLAPRSGLALKHNITLQNSPGIIDSGYRGEIIALVRNEGREPFIVKRGMKICQAILMELPAVKLWRAPEALTSTSRGSNGFGSTGV